MLKLFAAMVSDCSLPAKAGSNDAPYSKAPSRFCDGLLDGIKVPPVPGYDCGCGYVFGGRVEVGLHLESGVPELGGAG